MIELFLYNHHLPFFYIYWPIIALPQVSCSLWQRMLVAYPNTSSPFPSYWKNPNSYFESACNSEDPGSIPGSGRSAREGMGYPLQYSWASLVAQLIKNPPAVWRPGFNPWIGKIPWRRERLPTPVFWPGEFDTTEWLTLSHFQFLPSKITAQDKRAHFFFAASHVSQFKWLNSVGFPGRLLKREGGSCMILVPVFLPSHILLAYNSGPMARSLAIIFDHEVSYRMEAGH